MSPPDRKQVWKASLTAMRNSLLGNYEMSTTLVEQEKFLKCWSPDGPDFLVYSGYRRNEGKKRVFDILTMIDNALEQIELSDLKEASKIYLETIKSVAMYSRLVHILEKMNREK